MRLSAVIHGRQQVLAGMPSDRVITNAAGARATSGLIVEQALAELLGASRCQIDSRADYCADMKLPGGQLIECKLVTNSIRAPVLLMADRIAKDIELVGSGHRLAYAFCIASRAATFPARLQDFADDVLRAVTEVIVVDFRYLRQLLHGRAPRRLWDVERPGWRLTVAEIRRAARGLRVRKGKPSTTQSIRPARVLDPVPDFNPDVTGNVHLTGFPLTAVQVREIKALQGELSRSFLDVVTAPAPDPRHRNHKVRVVQNRNPDWYSRLADVANAPTRRRGRSRKGNTAIRRYLLNDAIDRLLAGKQPATRYDWLALEIVSATPAEDGSPC